MLKFGSARKDEPPAKVEPGVERPFSRPPLPVPDARPEEGPQMPISSVNNAESVLAAGLTQYVSKDKLWNKWQSLTAREQDVAALACLGYTNREIGKRLSISPETVKVRLQRALMKFGVTTRSQLRMLLEEWDFSAWEKPRYR